MRGAHRPVGRRGGAVVLLFGLPGRPPPDRPSSPRWSPRHAVPRGPRAARRPPRRSRAGGAPGPGRGDLDRAGSRVLHLGRRPGRDGRAELAAYAEGREAARRAVELAPRAPLAHLFYGINTGRWGQTQGVLRSLFLLPEVRESIRKTLELDPSFPNLRARGQRGLRGPGMFGGSLERAEAHFRKGLGLDSRFTALRVGLAKVLRKQGRTADARRELQAVLDETAPTNPAEWSMRDAPEARALLAALGR